MRMKEDAMRNGQTKPGYNASNRHRKSVHHRFCTLPEPYGYTLTLIPFVQSFSNRYDRIGPYGGVADSGYGSEENYRFMSEKRHGSLRKVQLFPHGAAEIQNPDPFKAENFYYNEEHDFCICPMGAKDAEDRHQGCETHPDMSAKMHGTELSGVELSPAMPLF